MPRVPDNTISDVAAAKVTKRNPFSISPSAFPSMGGPLAQAARAMDTAIALEGRRGDREARLELQRGRDARNRHLQHARDWEAAFGAMSKATDTWNRVMEHRADDEATRRLTEAERAMTEGTMGQLSPTGDPTGGAFNTPYVPGDPEGNQPGQGASSETGKLAAKVREAAYDGASGRVRYRLDRKFDGVVAPYLRKAQQIDFASAKKLELDTRTSDAAAAAERAVSLNSGLETAFGIVADQDEWVENKATTLNLGASVAEAAQKQAVAAMLKAGYRPINNDFENPQYAGDAQKLYAQMAKEAGEALSVRIVQNHAQAMVDEETDENAEARKDMCEFIADGLEEAGNTEAAAQARKMIKTGEAARERRIAVEYSKTVYDAENAAFDAFNGDMDANDRLTELSGKLKPADRDALQKRLNKWAFDRATADYEKRVFDMMKLTDPEARKAEADRIEAEVRSQDNPKLHAYVSRMLAGADPRERKTSAEGRMSATTARLMAEDMMARGMSGAAVLDALSTWRESGEITGETWGACFKDVKEGTFKDLDTAEVVRAVESAGFDLHSIIELDGSGHPVMDAKGNMKLLNADGTGKVQVGWRAQDGFWKNRTVYADEPFTGILAGSPAYVEVANETVLQLYETAVKYKALEKMGGAPKGVSLVDFIKKECAGSLKSLSDERLRASIQRQNALIESDFRAMELHGRGATAPVIMRE